MGPTVPAGTNLHVWGKFGRGGPYSTTGKEVERRQLPLYHQEGTREEAGPTVSLGTKCELEKKLGRNGSHCATRDKFACRKKVWQGCVPLYH